MRRYFRIFMILSLALSIVMACFLVSLGASKVTYKNHAEEFIFTPGTEYSPTDLFTNYKGVMPGDSIKQKITVRNQNKSTVKIYMRCLGVTDGKKASYEESEDFLSKLTLTIDAGSINNKSGGKLFQAPADQKGGLKKWKLLGTFKKGADVDLDVLLDVPIELDNAYMNRIGYLQWEFAVKIVEDDKAKGKKDDDMVIFPIAIDPDKDKNKDKDDNGNKDDHEELAIYPISIDPGDNPDGDGGIGCGGDEDDSLFGNIVKTGDTTKLYLWLAICIAAIAVLLILILVRRRTK